MNSDTIKGKAREIKGDIKQKAGRMTGNVSTEAEGAAEKLAGKAQKSYGQFRDSVEKE